MKQFRFTRLALGLTTLLIVCGISFSSVNADFPLISQDREEWVTLPNRSFPPSTARPLGIMPDDQLMHGTIYFRVNNEADLDYLLTEQQDPQSANYQKWLTPTEFGERFGLSATAHQNMLDWLESAGIKPTNIWANRLAIEFDARADQVERIFRVRPHFFALEDQTFYGNIAPVQLPTRLAPHVQAVKLDNFLLAHPLVRTASTQIAPNANVGGRIAIGPQDLRFVYNLQPLFDQGIDGSGQAIGIVARNDFQTRDVERFRSLFNLPAINLVKIPSGGEIVNRGGVEELEVLLDTQLSSATAPKATVQVVIADKDSEIDQSLAFLVNNMVSTKVISISFGLCERDLGPSFQAVFNNLYKQAAAQGQTILVSSGDGGANDCRDGKGQQVNGLTSSPFVVSVGGTTLNVTVDNDGNVNAYKGERAWNGSGGGISLIYQRPTYQRISGIPEGTTRTVPDISLLADPGGPGYFVVQNGSVLVVGGTSASSPPCAGIFALVNQFAKTQGVGVANTRIYQLGTQQLQGGAKVFNDVTQGENSSGGVRGFPARAGYDLSTGWGSPNGDLFVRNFTTLPDTSNGLFLLTPNGGEFFDKAQPLSVNWRLSDELASQTTKQNVMLSTDNGATFQTIGDTLDANARSMQINLPDLVNAMVRVRIVVRTNAGKDVIDTSDASINVGTSLRVEFADYSLGLERLDVMGTGFTADAKIIINGKKIKRKPRLNNQQDTLLLTGKMKKLGLKQGNNEIVVMVDGVRSVTYVLVL